MPRYRRKDIIDLHGDKRSDFSQDIECGPDCETPSLKPHFSLSKNLYTTTMVFYRTNRSASQLRCLCGIRRTFPRIKLYGDGSQLESLQPDVGNRNTLTTLTAIKTSLIAPIRASLALARSLSQPRGRFEMRNLFKWPRQMRLLTISDPRDICGEGCHQRYRSYSNQCGPAEH
jgi:hypothetical protein